MYSITFLCFAEPGTPNMFVNGEEMSSLEDIRKWTTEDVYNFISEIPSCSEYAQVLN